MKSILITGGAGFIGSNTAAYYLKKGKKVIVLDNFSRNGCKSNIKWLKTLGGKLSIVKADIRFDTKTIEKETNKVEVVLHLAAQVAVTTSVENPREDFDINALGTFNVLEAVRNSKNKPILLYSSTNKVYGGMEDVKIKELKTRYAYKDFPKGISEKHMLDFHSPYGCSKGAADQYVRDYARIYGLKTVVFRQSCIYGTRQFGVEDQGWLAWFIIAFTKNKKVTIYGDGKQVRDALYVSDLINAYDLAIKKINKTKGQVYNIGGGHNNTISIWVEFKPILEDLFGKKLKVDRKGWRPGDQKLFVSDNSKFEIDTGWTPKVNIMEGSSNLHGWVLENINLF